VQEYFQTAFFQLKHKFLLTLAPCYS